MRTIYNFESMPKPILYICSLLFIVIVVGCGPSFSDQEKVRKEKFEESKKQKTQKASEVVAGLQAKYQAVEFPWNAGTSPNEIFFSALAQRFIVDNRKKAIIFVMNLDDVEQTRGGLVANFSMNLGTINDVVGIPKELKLSLNISEAQFHELRSMPLAKKTSLSLRYIGASIVVVARVDQLGSLAEGIHLDDEKYTFHSEMNGKGMLLDAKVQ